MGKTAARTGDPHRLIHWRASARWLVRHGWGDADLLITEVGRAVRFGQWRRFWLGPAAALVVAALAVAARSRPGYAWVRQVAIVRADQPWNLWLARLPMSMFAPAQLLPYWVAMLEVLLAFGVGQVVLGWWRTLLLAFAGHAVATASAQLWVWLGPPVGVATKYLHVPDAGPSAAVLALTAYLAVRYQLSWLVAGMALFQVIETVTLNGLTQREHFIGVLVGIVAGTLGQRLPARSGSDALATSPAGTP